MIIPNQNRVNGAIPAEVGMLALLIRIMIMGKLLPITVKMAIIPTPISLMTGVMYPLP
jgi:hypothetical protein